MVWEIGREVTAGTIRVVNSREEVRRVKTMDFRMPSGSTKIRPLQRRKGSSRCQI